MGPKGRAVASGVREGEASLELAVQLLLAAALLSLHVPLHSTPQRSHPTLAILDGCPLNTCIITQS